MGGPAAVKDPRESALKVDCLGLVRRNFVYTGHRNRISKGDWDVMSEDFKLKNVFMVAVVIGAVVLLASIVGVIVNLP